MDFNLHWQSSLGEYAWYLLAPNQNIAEFAHKPINAGLAARLPAGVEPKNLNFLDPGSPFFYWPNVLYTAAFAVGKSRDNIITARDRSTSFVLGDSGGFSLISGAVKASMASWREETLRWQEAVCDIGICVDVPTRATLDPRSGYTSTAQCLAQTVRNTQYVIDNRSSSSLKMLLAYQGIDAAGADNWAKVMEPFQSDFEGIAVAGHTRLDIARWIRRFIGMIERKTFDKVYHIHFLGTAQPRFAVLSTAVQRAIRKHVRTDFRVTFDSSTSFTFVQRNGQIVTGLEASRKDFRMTNHTMPYRGGEFNPLVPFPYRSPLADRCVVGDFLPGTDTTRNPADGAGNNMLSHHSAYTELSAILQANRLMDMAQQGANGMAPHGLILAVELIDQAFSGSGKALDDLQRLMRSPANRLEPDALERADD